MRRIKFKKYAGVKIQGEVAMDPPGSKHIEKASWLTAMVESGGDFGTVISYDGTGMTAGLHQAIAVYPRELANPDDYALDDQGPLWKLVQRCLDTGHLFQERYDLVSELYNAGFELVNGVVREWPHGEVVDGKRLRLLLTGDADGEMPQKGEGRLQAERWAQLFSAFFSHPDTHAVQQAWGAEKLIKRIERTPLRYASAPYWRGRNIQEVFYDREEIPAYVGTVCSDEMVPEFDLAMCMWMSYTVNAPAIALKKICKLIKVYNQHGTEEFSRRLVNALGNAKWGRWDDDIKNGRYQRTRKYAMQLFPRELFEGPKAIMPKNLVG